MFDLSPHTFMSSASTPVSASHALQQSDLWLRAARILGSDARRQPVAGTQALVMHKRWPLLGPMALVSRADLSLDPGQAGALRRDLGVRHVVVNAERPEDAIALAGAGFRRIAAPRLVAELTLPATPDIMASRLSPKWRNRLRHGQAQGLELRRSVLPPSANHWLLRAEARQATRLWYQPMPPAMIAALAAARPGAAQLFTAYHLGRKIAAMLFLRHGRSATYQIGWSDQDGRKRSAGSALMWKAMVDLQQMGVDRIDLGAADPDRAPGLARFKRGTGAQLRALGGTWLESAALPRTGKVARAGAMADLRGAKYRHILTETGPFAAGA